MLLGEKIPLEWFTNRHTIDNWIGDFIPLASNQQPIEIVEDSSDMFSDSSDSSSEEVSSISLVNLPVIELPVSNNPEIIVVKPLTPPLTPPIFEIRSGWELAHTPKWNTGSVPVVARKKIPCTDRQCDLCQKIDAIRAKRLKR